KADRDLAARAVVSCAQRFQRGVDLGADLRVIEFQPVGVLQNELFDGGAVQQRYPRDLALITVLVLHRLRYSADNAPRQLARRLDAQGGALEGADQGRQAGQVRLSER